ncbi:TetR/AcrR family transcriptional regulator [Endozoicomonas atrinae]|uniref:TetR/AcrR family transcriptional regulator n=1 Tax=Endozoicomonas atrinae TaxID=1333660 RepID=UPI000826C492|nr:TetR/AcrR family transcriptional regulator [Endozoicomonas atrinae]
MSVKANKPVKKRGRPSVLKGQMSTEKIVLKAKELLKEEGKIPSIRKLASALDVDAMAIYYYFENKNALLEAVTVSLVDAIYDPVLSIDWHKELHQLCLSYLQLLQDHPGLLETLLSMGSHGPAEVFIERFERAVSPLNLPDTYRKSALDLLVDYLHGFALALNCQQASSLSVELLDGPLMLYIDMLMLKKHHKK